MLVIVEGIDRVGKTTLCNLLARQGFAVFKDNWMMSDVEAFESQPLFCSLFSQGKLDTSLNAIKALLDQGLNVVCDRLHLTELAYGLSRRSYDEVDSKMYQKEFESKLKNIAGSKLMIVLVEPTDIKEANERAGFDMEELNKSFCKLLMSSTISKTYCTNYNMLDKSAGMIFDSTFKYDLYLASPFFNDEQNEREAFVKSRLKAKSFNVFAPKDMTFIHPEASSEQREAAFQDNLNAIRKSAGIFVITNGKDVGTIWEAGYAYALGKPVIYFAEGLEGGFNLMLAQSGNLVITSRDGINEDDIIDALLRKGFPYGGTIE